MIAGFKDADAERLWQAGTSRRIPADLRRSVLRKLLHLQNAEQLSDLRIPPGNRLEALSGDRVGQHSIRVNDQFRICFVWRDGNAYQVEIVDYH